MLNNFQTPSILLGLFLRKLDVQDFAKFAETLPWRLPEFDAKPVMAQLPPNAPPEAPRVRFGSGDGRLLLEVAPRKLHFRMMPGDITRTEQGANIQALPVGQAFEKFLAPALRVYSTLSEHFDAKANRLGVVVDVIAPVPSSANQRMQQNILKNRNYFGERLHELQVQALAKTHIANNLSVNRRVLVRSMRSNQPGQPDLILNVNIDMNTLPEEPYDVGAADLEAFLKGVATHIETEIPVLNEKSFFE